MAFLEDKVVTLEFDFDCIIPEVEKYKKELYKIVRGKQDVSSPSYYEIKGRCFEAIKRMLDLEEQLEVTKIKIRRRNQNTQKSGMRLGNYLR